MQIKRWHLSSSPQNSNVLDESKSSLLLFDIVSTTFIPGKISSVKRCRSYSPLPLPLRFLVIMYCTSRISVWGRGSLISIFNSVPIFKGFPIPKPRTQVVSNFYHMYALYRERLRERKKGQFIIKTFYSFVVSTGWCGMLTDISWWKLSFLILPIWCRRRGRKR